MSDIEPGPDTERPTAPDLAAPTMPPYDGFPRPPRTGDPVLDTLLGVTTELRDVVIGLGRDVREMAGRVSGMENAVNRRRERDEANQQAMRSQLHNLSTAFESFREEFSGRFDRLEERVARLEEWRDAHANGTTG